MSGMPGIGGTPGIYQTMPWAVLYATTEPISCSGKNTLYKSDECSTNNYEKTCQQRC